MAAAQRSLPRPFAECPAGRLAALRGLLTDIDDTLTRDGAIEPVALAALRRLADARIPVIAITGRSTGWSEPFARDWPLAAIVAENGAVLLQREGRKLRREFADPPARRAANTRRLAACAKAVLAEVPGAALARDSAGRRTDIAVDHAEFSHLDPARIDAVVAVMRRHGLVASVSSIHVNGWIGTHSKWTGASWGVARCTGQPLDPLAWAYVGDSANDAVMFEHLALGVGVANITPLLPRMTALPHWITVSERGAGFAEFAARVLAARRG